VKVWKIQGYDGQTKIYDIEVKEGLFTENKIQELLKILVAKTSLEFDEIVGAYARKRSKISNDLLLVKRDGSKPIFNCGENPYFTARIVNLN